LRVCRALLDDRDDMVVSDVVGLAWWRTESSGCKALRPAGERRLAARVRREVMNKIESGVKSRRDR
jgi:hypothetical protein